MNPTENRGWTLFRNFKFQTLIYIINHASVEELTTLSKTQLDNLHVLLLWKESLNSDSQQFCHINKTNNHLSPQLIEEKKITRHYDFGNPVYVEIWVFFYIKLMIHASFTLIIQKIQLQRRWLSKSQRGLSISDGRI